VSLYVVDASVWIDAWRRYPPSIDVFRPIWDGLDSMIADGSLRSPEEIRQELERGTDGLPLWLAPRRLTFHPLDSDLQAGVTLVMSRFSDMVDPDSDKSRGDPFVVALAQAKSGIVVSSENGRKHPTGRPKIPDACAGFGIRCLKWLDFLREPDVGSRMSR
jgi:hypothetical protein